MVKLLLYTCLFVDVADIIWMLWCDHQIHVRSLYVKSKLDYAYCASSFKYIFFLEIKQNL